MDLERLTSDFHAALQAAGSDYDVYQVKSVFLGKKSELSQALKSLVKAAPEERARLGLAAKQFKTEALAAIDDRLQALVQKRIEQALAQRELLLGINEEVRGSVHPLCQVFYELTEILRDLGFSYREGNEVETPWCNFNALNIPDEHPARQVSDTFYTDDGRLLRTHTSSVQVHVLRQQKPPIRVACPGRVYRNESDRTHSPMFHQLECLCIEEGVHMGMLMDVLQTLLERFFNAKVRMRARPNYFPFTEPSMEIDLWHQGQWMEVLGSGMVHPNVLRLADLNPDEHQGFAFGIGLERMAMLKYGIMHIGDFYQNHAGFLNQFRG